MMGGGARRPCCTGSHTKALRNEDSKRQEATKTSSYRSGEAMTGVDHKEAVARQKAMGGGGVAVMASMGGRQGGHGSGEVRQGQ